MSDRIMIDMSYLNMGGARVYEKIVPTLTSRDYKEPRLILEKNIMTDREIKLGNLNGFTGGNFAGNVYDKNMLSPCISTMSGGGQQPMILEEPCIVAMRGRNPERPTDRTAELPTEQRLEVAENGIVNTLTTVQKDNLVLEPRCLGGIGEKWGDKQYHQQDRVYSSDGIAMCQPANIPGGSYKYLVKENKEADESNGEKDFAVIDAYNKREIDNKVYGCLTANGNVSSTHAGTFLIKEDDTASNSESINYVESRYRIRKLTEKETWRLMGFTDEDFNKARAVNSATRCYKQAGNSIVKQVLMAIFLQMGIQGKPRWNDMSVEERQKLVESSLDFLEK